MGLSGPQGHRLMAVSPARTDPIKPRTAERRAHRRIGRYDLRHVVQARALERVEIVGDPPVRMCDRWPRVSESPPRG